MWKTLRRLYCCIGRKWLNTETSSQWRTDVTSSIEEIRLVTMKSYHLRWSSHLPNMGSVFSSLYQSEGLADVNLCCEDGSVRAHKLLLSTCSDYFLVSFRLLEESRWLNSPLVPRQKIFIYDMIHHCIERFLIVPWFIWSLSDFRSTSLCQICEIFM